MEPVSPWVAIPPCPFKMYALFLNVASTSTRPARARAPDPIPGLISVYIVFLAAAATGPTYESPACRDADP